MIRVILYNRISITYDSVESKVEGLPFPYPGIIEVESPISASTGAQHVLNHFETLLHIKARFLHLLDLFLGCFTLVAAAMFLHLSKMRAAVSPLALVGM